MLLLKRDESALQLAVASRRVDATWVQRVETS